MIPTNHFIAEAPDGERSVEYDRSIAARFAGKDGRVGLAVGLEDGEVVVDARTLEDVLEDADWSPGVGELMDALGPVEVPE